MERFFLFFVHLQREQLASHEEKVLRLGDELTEHKRNPPPSKGLQLQNYIEKDVYLQYEVRVAGTQPLLLYLYLFSLHFLISHI